MVKYLNNLQNKQYNRFESMFRSERRDEIIQPLKNMSKSQVVAILDSYAEMVHEEAPDVIQLEDCIELTIKNGIIENDLYDIGNMYRALSASVIDVVEVELYNLLPDPDPDENVAENADCTLSKICGEVYYGLEDELTTLFKRLEV